jgi:hypothetical protein
MSLVQINRRTKEPSVDTLTLKDLKAYVGGLSKPSKMPGYSYGLPAQACKVGSKLAQKEGSVCSGCYALKGNYTFPSVALSQSRKLAAIKRKQWVPAMVRLIAYYSPEVFRWHDSGDIQSAAHLRRIVQVAEALPDTKFWLPTREVRTVRAYLKRFGEFPSNLVVRMSALMVDTAPPTYAMPEAMTTSTVHTGEAPKGKGNIECRAYLRDGSCGSCRACWSPKVSNVSYRAH